jgi:hypothetical protein
MRLRKRLPRFRRLRWSKLPQRLLRNRPLRRNWRSLHLLRPKRTASLELASADRVAAVQAVIVLLVADRPVVETEPAQH